MRDGERACESMRERRRCASRCRGEKCGEGEESDQAAWHAGIVEIPAGQRKKSRS